jgi:cytochrome c biogenesis protein CcdA
MELNWLFGISLTASFLAGVLALFAPCCITFLLPSYLGTVFKAKNKVMGYTLIFSLGLAFVLVPIALGFRAAIYFLDNYHLQVYYLGALVMILMGIMTLKPIFHLPQIFHTSIKPGKKINAISIFGLGLMSGLTSACCAPVLFAAVTLTSMSPSLLQAVIVAFAYVIGIVMPLFIMSLIYARMTVGLSGPKRQKIYTVLKYLGAIIFFITGILIAVFNYLGKIQMNQMEPYSQKLRLVVFEIAKYFQNPLVDVLVFAAVLLSFYKLLKWRNNAKK